LGTVWFCVIGASLPHPPAPSPCNGEGEKTAEREKEAVGGITMSNPVIVRGGRVVTPSEVIAADVLIEGERIAGLVAPGSEVWTGAREIDAGDFPDG
jgi:adenine deaminase